MKRLFGFVFVAMILLSGTAFAANWVWVSSDEECTLYIDSYNVDITIGQYGLPTYVKCYAKFVYAEEDEYGTKYFIMKNKYRAQGNPTVLSNVQRCSTGTLFYDSNDNLLDSFSASYEDWEDVIPDTFGEGLYFAAWECYANNVRKNTPRKPANKPITDNRKHKH